MSPAKTTIVLVLLSGNENTSRQLDPLLREIQNGINAWRDCDTAPDVYCLYHRWRNAQEIQTWYYRIGPGTLTFLTDPNSPLLDPATYPDLIPGARQLTGDLGVSVGTFAAYVASQLCGAGPIRLIFGAHGRSGVGLNSTSLYQLLWMALQSTNPSFDKDLLSLDKLVPLRQEILRISQEIYRNGTPPSAFTSTADRTRPDLTLNAAAAALMHLPESRLQTLILHTCEMSGVETICALKRVRHHIACESEFERTMLLSEWFSVLSDPSATDERITRVCFESLDPTVPPDDAKGCFSSHHTSMIFNLLNYLNDLGDELYRKITLGDERAVCRAVSQIQLAYGFSVVRNCVDVSQFCTKLHEFGVITPRITRLVVDGVDKLQLAEVFKNNDWQGSPVCEPYRGISMFLPPRGSSQYTTADLPWEFQSAAARWCRFVDAWQTIRAAPN